ncbi:ABC transporter transmembrane domain-containing protein [Pseudoalteromonas sp. JC3]|uniref:ABC transporter transmembrane domain-containing protein n=1 Tax=Pseudoalteromonas sp. JC3 TaxID=2810196 RepID=UPI0019D316B7|nr:ABC transporter transmembrane domain-containing protein [Pseudoalteromonas sp. JC3]MBR8844116.1 ATP-binding cassette domain-containing protein [Pseudoalteromonas sp. JC3]WJE10843.1 ABC transporter transmembrane domain-containing protein [Pseudoalteromonas sp. JC3]
MIKHNHAATGDMEVAATELLHSQQHKVKNALLGVLALKSSAFLCQLTAFAAFSFLMARLLASDASSLVISHFFSANTHYEWTLNVLVGALVSSLILNLFAHNRLMALQASSLADLEAQLHGAFKQGQHALVRQHSHFYWQQLSTEHLHAMVKFISEFQLQKWFAVFAPLLLLGVIAYVNWFVFIILLVCLPVVPLFMIIIGKGTKHLHNTYFVAFERLGSMFANRLSNIELINVFSANRQQTQHLEQSSNTLNSSTMKVLQVAFLNQTVLDFFSTLSMALIAVYVGFNLLEEINLGPKLVFADGLFLLIAVPMVFSELKQLGNLYHQKAAAQVAASELASVLCNSQKSSDISLSPSIDWHDFQVVNTVVFAKHLFVERGQHIWLSAPSGAGKTLLFEALSKQRQASHQTTQKVALLTQSPCILRGTVRDNLTLNRPISDKALFTMLEKVELMAWYKNLKQGLNTPMDECPPLSGGEKQRLSLARLLSCDADLYLLDEPTAFLSDAQHLRLCCLIETVLKDKTVIWACHKPQSQRWFSHIWHINEFGEVLCHAN